MLKVHKSIFIHFRDVNAYAIIISKYSNYIGLKDIFFIF